MSFSCTASQRYILLRLQVLPVYVVGRFKPVDQATFNINPIKPWLIGDIPEWPLTEQRFRIVYASNACHFFLFAVPAVPVRELVSRFLVK